MAYTIQELLDAAEKDETPQYTHGLYYKNGASCFMGGVMLVLGAKPTEQDSFRDIDKESYKIVNEVSESFRNTPICGSLPKNKRTHNLWDQIFSANDYILWPKKEILSKLRECYPSNNL